MQSDEIKSMEHAKRMVETRFRSRREVMESMGYDADEIDAENDRDRARLALMPPLAFPEESEHLEWEPDDDVAL